MLGVGFSHRKVGQRLEVEAIRPPLSTRTASSQHSGKRRDLVDWFRYCFTSSQSFSSSSSSFVLGVFRVVRAKLPSLAFSIHPSSILQNSFDPRAKTKDEED